MDPCLRDISEISLRCRRDVCDESCCEALKARLHGECSREWAHHHALYVFRKQREIRDACRRDCVPRVACFFMQSDAPCQARECRDLFGSGSMTPQCMARLSAQCAETPDGNDAACAALNATARACGGSGAEWLACAAKRHSGPDWIQDVELLRSRRVTQLRVSHETAQFIAAFGCTHTPLPGVRAPCPRGFFVVDALGHTAFHKSAFTATAVGSGYRDASAPNIAAVVLVAVFGLIFALLARLKL